MTVVLYSTVFSAMILLIALVSSLKDQANDATKAKADTHYSMVNPYLNDHRSIAKETREPLLLYNSQDSSSSSSFYHDGLAKVSSDEIKDAKMTTKGENKIPD